MACIPEYQKNKHRIKKDEKSRERVHFIQMSVSPLGRLKSLLTYLENRLAETSVANEISSWSVGFRMNRLYGFPKWKRINLPTRICSTALHVIIVWTHRFAKNHVKNPSYTSDKNCCWLHVFMHSWGVRLLSTKLSWIVTVWGLWHTHR